MYFIAAVLFLYLLFLILLICFFDKPDNKIKHKRKEIFISVVIPARDEADLHLLLSDLSHQTLSSDNYEVIVVDDNSLKKIIASGNGEVVLHQKKGIYGKKAALTLGIEHAKGDIITTIDADCRIGRQFLDNVHKVFVNYDVVLSPGLVRFASTGNFFEKMQAMENSAVMGMGLALHRMGITSLSNGANLAFSKKVWLEVGGYQKHQHIASGDDELFVQDVVKHYPDKVFFRTYEQSIVSTRAKKTFTDFIHQRLRWAGKWRKYEDIRMQGIAAVIFFIHLIICAGLILVFSDNNGILIGLFLLKILFEGYLILKTSKKLRSEFSILSFIILQFLYSPYVVILGLAANFVPYKWKDRQYRH